MRRGQQPYDGRGEKSSWVPLLSHKCLFWWPRRRLSQKRRIGHAYQGVADAWGLGITKIPAVVVDHRYVVYGEPDVARAVARINAYRSTQP